LPVVLKKIARQFVRICVVRASLAKCATVILRLNEVLQGRGIARYNNRMNRNSVAGDRCGDAGGFPLSARQRCNGRRQAERAGVTPRIARFCSSARAVPVKNRSPDCACNPGPGFPWMSLALIPGCGAAHNLPL
jgi:hypothetical protein